MQHHVALRVAYIERLRAVFAASGIVLSPEVIKGPVSGRGQWAGGRLRQDAWGELNCVWDDSTPALQQGPGAGAGGSRGGRSRARQRRGGASGGEVRQGHASALDFSTLDQVCWFWWTNWLVSLQLGATSSWKIKTGNKNISLPSLAERLSWFGFLPRVAGRTDT